MSFVTATFVAPMKPLVSRSRDLVADENTLVLPPQSEPYLAVLAELATIRAALRSLETQVLRLMHQAGITDEDIGVALNISSQAVGKKRRRAR